MDLLALFRRAELLRERNRELRDAVALSIERSKSAEAERPDYEAIARKIERTTATTSNPVALPMLGIPASDRKSHRLYCVEPSTGSRASNCELNFGSLPRRRAPCRWCPFGR